MKTKVINIKDRQKILFETKGVVRFVYIGRPSKWGNPFRMRSERDRKWVIEQYIGYLKEHPTLIAAARRELRGKVLTCYCKPRACHGDVLARIAEGGGL